MKLTPLAKYRRQILIQKAICVILSIATILVAIRLVAWAIEIQ